MTRKNQITVPAEITRKLGLRTGVQFDWAVSDQPNQIVITIRPTRRQLLERVRAIGRRYGKRGHNPIADLIREREEDERMREAALR